MFASGLIEMIGVRVLLILNLRIDMTFNHVCTFGLICIG